MNTQTTEDYLKTIYFLEQSESPVRTTSLAEAQGVAPASATNMMQRLAKDDLVKYEKQQGVTLTEQGKEIALQTIRRHRLLELFLVEKLGYGWDEVHEEAEQLEHVISDKFLERIAALLGHPAFDPHGDPIPAQDGSMTKVSTYPLSDTPVGKHITISRVIDDTNFELLQYLAELNLIPGTTVQVINKDPFDGPITLQIAGNQQIVGHRAATMVYVIKE